MTKLKKIILVAVSTLAVLLSAAGTAHAQGAPPASTTQPAAR